LSTPLFSAIGGLRGIKTKKRNPLNHHCLLYNRIVEMHRQIYGARHPLLANDLGSLAAVQRDPAITAQPKGWTGKLSISLSPTMAITTPKRLAA
jgi:hypothetical protein